MQQYDYIVLGAGIVGLTIARELKLREADATILIVEKEADVGMHASGRNSGVLHSGIYYPNDSIKAKVCVAGARSMAAYCDQHGLPIKRTGKVIVPTKEEDDSQIDMLYQRATANDANVRVLDAAELKDIEPEAHTASGRALHSPDTAVVDPLAILHHIANALKGQGVVFVHGVKCVKADPDASSVLIEDDWIHYGHLFNATGQHSDVVASLFGVGEQYTLIPFKGSYFQLRKDSDICIHGLIYPVPSLNVPFLGVHSVINVRGDVYFGPSAMPALGRENYHGFDDIKFAEVTRILYRLSQQYVLNNQGFRQLVHEEAIRMLSSQFVASVKMLVPRIDVSSLRRSEKVGIRPQLLDTNQHKLVMDFVVEHRENTTHVLNAISPAFTCSLSFATFVIDGVK